MAQFLRPGLDSANTSFFTQGGGTSSLYFTIRETTPNDADYIYSSNNTTAIYQCILGAANFPSLPGNYTVRYRIARTNNGVVDGAGNDVTVTVDLYQTSTLITTLGTHSTTGTWTTYAINLSQTNINAITSYSDIRLRFTTSSSGGGPSVRRGAAVSWVEFEIPDYEKRNHQFFLFFPNY